MTGTPSPFNPRATDPQYESNSPFAIRSIPWPYEVMLKSPRPDQPTDVTGNVLGEPKDVIGTTAGARRLESATAAALGHGASQP